MSIALRIFFILIVLFTVLFLSGSVVVMKTYHLTFFEVINKSATKLGLVEEGKRLLDYKKKYTEPVIALRHKDTFPRILPSDKNAGLTYSEYLKNNLSALEDSKSYTPDCARKNIHGLLYCYLLDELEIEELLRELTLYEFVPPREVGFYGNVLEFVVVLDVLRGSGLEIPLSTQAMIDEKLHQMLESYLFVLDGDSASLFHGRSVLASNAWLLATQLDSDEKRNQENINRAFGHFYDFFEALEAVEIWPEGYNYWANSRGFQITLAVSALKSLEPNELLLDVRAEALLERIGLWHIYNTRPDWTIAGWGDEGPRVDLRDETSRIIDLIALSTDNLVIGKYADLLRQRFGNFNYYRAYKWYLPLLISNEAVETDYKKNEEVTLEELAPFLIPTAIFGKGISNHIVIRSGWKNDDALIQIRASDRLTHHQHFDAGAFTIHSNGKPLIVNASRYKNIFSENRKYFSNRSISKNTIFINSQDDVFQPTKHYQLNSMDGGQRIPLATHSSITSFDNWSHELEHKNLAMAELIDSDFKANGDVNIWLDITSAYNSVKGSDNGSKAKAKRVKRQFYYLGKEQVLLIYDSIITTVSALESGTRLYFPEKPIISNLNGTVAKGNELDGIIEYGESNLVDVKVNGGNSILVYSPKRISTRLLGGKRYRNYVELDSDYTIYDGQTFHEGYDEERWFDRVGWRIETSQQANKNFELLTVITLSNGTQVKLEPNENYEAAILVNERKVASARFSFVDKTNYGISRNDE